MLVRDRLLPLTVDEPTETADGIERTSVVRTDDHIGAARPDLSVGIEVLVAIVAGWQLEADRDAGGTIVVKSRIDRPHPHIAESSLCVRLDLARVLVSCAKRPTPIRYFNRKAPIAVEHVAE